MPLDPTKFGLTEEQRIVIGENLTRKNAKLFKSAQSLRRAEKIAQTYTEDGLVKIKFQRGKEAHVYTVRNNIALESIVAQHEQTDTQSQVNANNNATANSIQNAQATITNPSSANNNINRNTAQHTTTDPTLNEPMDTHVTS